MKRSATMDRFEVQLLPQGCGRWAALMGGQILSTEIVNPRTEIAQLLLSHGADPRAQLVIQSGAKIIAFEMLGIVCGSPGGCGDVGVIEKD